MSAADGPLRGGEAALQKAMGVRALAATTFNVMIGGGIFLLPAVAAAGVGAAAPLVYLICALAMGLIVLCFAQAGSRVSLTGGPYAYVETAFGSYGGFIAGVLVWLLGTLATAAVASGFAGSIGVLWAPASSPAARALLLAAMLGFLALVNVRGVQRGSRLIEVITVAKLLPLVFFVVVGAFFVRVEHLRWADSPSIAELGRVAVQLMFAFAGLESALVPSGEVRDPARTVPRALLIAMLTVMSLYVCIQLVAQGTLGVRIAEATDAPLAEAARTFTGSAGAMILLVGASISMFGHVSGMTLATPRALFALGRDGFLPARVAAVHPRFHTPHIAIILQAAIVFAMATSGSFARLFVLATVAVLVLYLLCCAAAWELGRRDVRTDGTPFRIPGGALVPVLAVLVILWLLSSATLEELGAVGAVLAVASLVYVITASRRRQLALDRQ